MIIYLTTTKAGKQHTVRAETSAGMLVGQAVDRNPVEARRRVLRQARAWAKDRGWGELTIKTREASA